jgi:hypothetical protein
MFRVKQSYNYVVKDLNNYMLDRENIINKSNIFSKNVVKNKSYKPIDKPIEKPIVEIEKTIVEIEKPIVEIEKPIDKPIEKPIVKIEKPIVKIEKPIVKIEKPIEKKTTKVLEKYYPKQQDTLFWCFYYLKQSNKKTDDFLKHDFELEKEEKFAYIELVRKNKDKLKYHKIKPLIELENDLGNNKNISIKTFFALCIIENINILLVDKRKIYELILNTDNDVNIIHKEANSYKYYIELSIENIEKYRKTYYKMENLDSSLKAISSYKLDELKDLCIKLNVPIDDLNKKYKKKDLYELLVQNF